MMATVKVRYAKKVYAATFLFFALGVAPQKQAHAQEDRGQAQGTPVRGYWVHPSTGLMWAGKDNGGDVNWHKAMKHCRNLRLAGYSDWRLATLGELESYLRQERQCSRTHGSLKQGH